VLLPGRDELLATGVAKHSDSASTWPKSSTHCRWTAGCALVLVPHPERLSANAPTKPRLIAAERIRRGGVGAIHKPFRVPTSQCAQRGEIAQTRPVVKRVSFLNIRRIISSRFREK
jgi:hypothetical protein